MVVAGSEARTVPAHKQPIGLSAPVLVFYGCTLPWTVPNSHPRISLNYATGRASSIQRDLSLHRCALTFRGSAKSSVGERY